MRVPPELHDMHDSKHCMETLGCTGGLYRAALCSKFLLPTCGGEPLWTYCTLDSHAVALHGAGLTIPLSKKCIDLLVLVWLMLAGHLSILCG